MIALSDKINNTIFGENIILLPFSEVLDMADLVRLHRNDNKGYMCRFSLSKWDEDNAEIYMRNLIESGEIVVWGAYLKEQEILFGFIYLSNITDYSASINGVMDKSIIRDILKLKKREKISYADEATNCLINFCFNNGFIRIEGDALECDREAIALHKRIGFKQEGLLRKAVRINDKYTNLIIVSILKEEYENGKVDAQLQSAGSA